MTTPIVMLILMSGPYLLVRFLARGVLRHYNARRAAAIGLVILFIFTGVGHFIDTESMAHMLPPWIPERRFLVYLTGVLELAIAAGFLIRKSRQITGWIAGAMLVLFFPVNIYAAISHAPMGGHAWGPVYLLVRTPLQVMILLWIYWFTIRSVTGRSKEVANFKMAKAPI